MHILVLDRRRRRMGSPVDLLRQWGHLADRTNDVDDAFKRLSGATPPDVLFIDISGLGAAALDLVRRVRSEMPRQAAYILALIDKRDEEKLLPMALKAGVDDYVARPVLSEALELRLLVCQRIRGFGNDPLDARGRLLFMATHDALTSLWNRSSIAGHLYRAMARAARDGSSLAVIMCDVDHFKRINDTRGHVVGDEVLRVIAQRLRAVVRPHDLVGRYGGEEFVILVPGCARDMAADIADRARRAVSGTPIATSSGPQDVTISLGVANLSDVDAAGAQTSPHQLIEACDQAMYAAKAAGRNRVVVWSQRPGAPAASA
jgi:two-component system, cell cycle response regulator